MDDARLGRRENYECNNQSEAERCHTLRHKGSHPMQCMVFRGFPRSGTKKSG